MVIILQNRSEATARTAPSSEATGGLVRAPILSNETIQEAAEVMLAWGPRRERGVRGKLTSLVAATRADYQFAPWVGGLQKDNPAVGCLLPSAISA